MEPEWKLEDMRVVAVISRDMAKNGYRNANVMNCAECSLSGFSSIQSPFLSGEGWGEAPLFDMLGRPVKAADKLPRGLYILKGEKVLVK